MDLWKLAFPLACVLAAAASAAAGGRPEVGESGALSPAMHAFYNARYEEAAAQAFELRAAVPNDLASYERMRDKILDEAKRAFRPEFMNRLDDIIVFRPLTKPELIEVLELEIHKVMDRLKKKQLKLNLDETAMNFLVEKGYDPQYGARPMRRSVERFLEDPLAEELLKAT